jgi:hypothetical protein
VPDSRSFCPWLQANRSVCTCVYSNWKTYMVPTWWYVRLFPDLFITWTNPNGGEGYQSMGLTSAFQLHYTYRLFHRRGVHHCPLGRCQFLQPCNQRRTCGARRQICTYARRPVPQWLAPWPPAEHAGTLKVIHSSEHWSYICGATCSWSWKGLWLYIIPFHQFSVTSFDTKLSSMH